MPEVKIANFGRPGIYVREFDNSVIDTPTVEGIQNLVLGFAKKGPYNTPVEINSLSDLDAIFGSIDRRLERKDSFFHRTISKLLESNPVTAINLLLTDDALDTIEYQSLSTSTKYSNDVLRTGPYSNFFDRSGFWKKSTETFINLVDDDVNSDQRVLNFTNMSDKPITVFTFKSNVQGYDVDMISWYGNPDNIPTYVYPTDYVSDYLVDVFVIAGDWTNYEELSVDKRWGAYFNTSGLMKDEVLNFVNDVATPTLGIYQALSLIPYFRDANNRDIFIENVLNLDTDKTGLFCAFDVDKLEDTDYPMGLVDLIGNNIAADLDAQSVDFLSYKDIISDKISYDRTVLDRPGNVISYGENYRTGGTVYDRTSAYGEGYIHSVERGSVTSSTSSVSFDYLVGNGDTADAGYVVNGGINIDLSTSGTQSFIIDSANYTVGVGSTQSFATTFVVDTEGEFKKYDNLTNSNPLNVSVTDIVLGTATFSIYNNGTASSIVDFNMTDITVGTAGYIELDSDDITLTVDSGDITLEFLDTASTPDTSEYLQYRKIKLFNELINSIGGANKDKMAMLIDGGEKVSLSNVVVGEIETSNSVNKLITLKTGLEDSKLTELVDQICFYNFDDELLLGTDGMITKTTKADAVIGSVGAESDFYDNYRDGAINTGDYFYENLVKNVTLDESYDITFGKYQNVDGSTYSYVVLDGDVDPDFDISTNVIFADSLLNTGDFEIASSNEIGSLTGSVPSGYAYRVTENVVDEVVKSSSEVYNADIKIYLAMSFDASNVLTVSFMDREGTAIQKTNNLDMVVVSQKSNYRQTVEIETANGVTQMANKILVNGSRYTELAPGDFLLADVDESTLEPGEVPKYLARIITKKVYPNDSSLVEISCDLPIKKTTINGDLQTTAFTKIDDYITEYKGFSMSGFKVRQASLPDGTEQRQDEILNLVSKGTSLFKSLTNKDIISFRYIVDSFGLGLTELSKQQYVDIAGERLDCFAFINMPSMKEFKNSTSPSFTNPDGTINTEYIKLGGDPKSNPAFLYSFGEGVGVSSVGYFTPYLTVSDNGRPLSIPPAAWVATTYLRKFSSVQTNIKPWTVAAGVVNGQITGIGKLEIDFAGEDITNLNEMKANPIVTKKNRGFVIETENTAQTFVRSALSFIHVREVLIELEDELRDMLMTYQWKFNTADTRGEIKLRADLICEKYVNQGGLFAFFNKCDEENNTNEIIDNQMGILDTYVEPIKAMAIIVNNITILKTGAISSGGFQ